MTNISIRYRGDLSCEACHEASGVTITTDAPVDNEGRGGSFSPTDLAATALGTCMLTIMGIVARRHGIDLGSTSVRVAKEMSAAPPRRIARLVVVFSIPLPPAHEKRTLLENAAKTCPVHLSLHSDIEQETRFEWVG